MTGRSSGEQPLSALEVEAIRRVQPPEHGRDFWEQLGRIQPGIGPKDDGGPSGDDGPDWLSSPVPSLLRDPDDDQVDIFGLSPPSNVRSRRGVALAVCTLLVAAAGMAYQGVRSNQGGFEAVIVESPALDAARDSNEPLVQSGSVLPPDSASALEGAQGDAVVQLNAVDMTKHVAGGETDSGWRMWGNGHIEQVVPFANGDYRVVVTAVGHSTVSSFEPEMSLRVDDVNQGRRIVELATMRAYEFRISVSEGEHVVAVAFTNDPNRAGLDVDLEIGTIVIEPVR